MLIQSSVKTIPIYFSKLSQHPLSTLLHSNHYNGRSLPINMIWERRLFSTSQQSMGFDPRVNYYKLLEVSEQATENEIKKAFYVLAKKFHPDSAIKEGKDKRQQQINEDKFKEISNAYEVLSDQQRRSNYDDLRSQYTGKKSSPNSSYNSEHTYTYDSYGKKKEDGSYWYSESSYWNQDHHHTQNSQQSNSFYQNSQFNQAQWERANYYGDARYEYQKQEKYQQGQSYKDYYNQRQKENFQEFYSQRQQQRQERQAWNDQQYGVRGKPTEQDFLKQFVVSFLGFSLVTFFLFGLGGQKSSPAHASPSQSYNQPSFAAISGQQQMVRAYNPQSLQQIEQQMRKANQPQQVQHQQTSGNSTFQGRITEYVKLSDPQVGAKTELVIRINSEDQTRAFKKQRGGVMEVPEVPPDQKMTKAQKRREIHKREVEFEEACRRENSMQIIHLKPLELNYKQYDKMDKFSKGQYIF